MEDDKKVENEDKESDENAQNETEIVTNLLDKDETINLVEKVALKEGESDNIDEVCQTVAEKATTSENEPCDKCKQVFEFNKKDVNYSMCDECIVKIANKEGIELPYRYQCKICNQKLKQKHSLKNIRIALDLEAVLLYLFVKTVTKTGKTKTHLRNTWYRNTLNINVFVAMLNWKAKKILMNTLELSIRRFSFLTCNLYTQYSCYHNGRKTEMTIKKD